MKELPKYAMIGRTAMELIEEVSYFYDGIKPPFYYRTAGCWSLKVKKNENGEWRTFDNENKWLNDLEIVEISKEDWEEDNKGFI